MWQLRRDARKRTGAVGETFDGRAEGGEQRLGGIGDTTRTPLPEEGGDFIGTIDPPAKGWTAFFVELTYDVGQSLPLKLTTGVRILPDTLPFANLDPTKAQLKPRPSRN